ncbi:MAG: uroporphyrinogen-III C-methyltransferase [Lachnospiraceae bacterium]
MGKVYLVGAGPGDAGLITVKGLEKLRQCDAVVYDRLATEELLDFLRLDCEKIYVGKEAGKHYKKQDEINRILVECAKKHQLVVRLKGGDPFVFGRGGEEIEALEQYDIPYEVIPGVTSAVAVPECAGIPVTHRGVSRSFHVITGHTKNSVDSPDYDYKAMAGYEGTLVFLMGLSNLGSIAEKLILAGKPADTSVAVISNGTTRYQKILRGTLADIAKKVKENEMESPAVIVIGETAGYEYLYRSASYKKVGVTATELLWKKLENGLEGIGMQPVPLCNMKVVPEQGMQELDGELKHLNQYQWILFTSQNAIRIFFGEMKKEQVDIRVLGSLRFAVLGSGTAEKLLEYGIKADFVPSKYTVTVLAEEFSHVVKPDERVLIPRAVQGSPELSRVLADEHISHMDIPIYDVVGTLTKNIKCLDDLDYLVFVSASGVTAFFEQLRKQRLALPQSVKIACIGNITQKRLLQEYGEADVVAAVNDVEGLLDAIKQYENLK